MLKIVWVIFYVIDVVVLLDSVVKCEYFGFVVIVSFEARYSVEVALVYFYDYVDLIYFILNGWIIVVVLSYILYIGFDELFMEILDLGGSVVSIIAIYIKFDTAGGFVDYIFGWGLFLDVVCVFGIVYFVLVCYNVFEIFECVVLVVLRVVFIDVSFLVILFASSMFISYLCFEFFI